MPDDVATPRVSSVDTYRGFVMFLMLAEVLRLASYAKNFPDSQFWQQVKFHTSHVDWTGCSLHDMIQPSFSFLVGVALIFSLKNRKARGQSIGISALHAAWRSILLILLGIFLRSQSSQQTNFTFEDTLTQIGLGYLPLFGIALLPKRWWIFAFVGILIAYWAAFERYPQPAANFNYEAVGVKADWPHHATGMAGHWNKNSNIAWAFDVQFLNLFPREKAFTHNGGGYATLSFIPTLTTMILGLFAGSIMLTNNKPWGTIGLYVVIGAVLIFLGITLAETGVCPIVKRIWTPSWVLYSGGICFCMLAFFHATTDAIGYSGWSWPLRVIGANSILIYCIADTPGIAAWIIKQFHTHFGSQMFAFAGEKSQGVIESAVVLILEWLFLVWLYMKRIFIRI